MKLGLNLIMLYSNLRKIKNSKWWKEFLKIIWLSF